MYKKPRKSALRNALRLGVENLEDRRLLAGNITATFLGGSLVLRGDAADNAITVSQPAPNKVTLIGKTNSGSATTINGSAGPVVFTGILQSIDADLKAGNDQFLVGNNSAEINALNNEILFGTVGVFSGLASARTVVQHSLIFRGGDGSDSAAIMADVGGNIYADMGANNDGVGVQGSLAKGSVILIGGSGDQPSLLVRNSTIGNQIIVQGATGANRVVIDAVNALGVTIATQNGNDQVSVLSSNIKFGVVMNTLGGIDNIVVGGSVIGGSLIVNSGADVDSVTIENTSIRFDALIYAGLGNDSVTIVSKRSASTTALATQTTIGGVLVVDLGLGNDTATIGSRGPGDSAVKVTGYTTLLGSDGNDQLTIRNSQFGSGVTVSMGSGKDLVSISDVRIVRNLSVFMGLGDDDLLIDATSAAVADLYGGLGNDGRNLSGILLGERSCASSNGPRLLLLRHFLSVDQHGSFAQAFALRKMGRLAPVHSPQLIRITERPPSPYGENLTESSR